MIPPEVIGYTAIGNIISRSYTLALIARVFCCYSDPCLSIPVVFTSSLEPEVEKEEVIEPPLGWSPMAYPVQTLMNLPPYMYHPVGGMVARNQGEGAQVNMRTDMTEIYMQ